MKGIMLAIRAEMTLLGFVMPAVTTAIRAMGLALTSNPIGLIIGGIALAAGLLITNWKPVGEFFRNLFSGIIGWAQSAFNWIGKLLTPLKPIVSAVGNFAGKAWNFASGSSDAKNPSSSGAVGNVVRNFENDSTAAEKTSSFETSNVSQIGGNNSRSNISISAPITINNSSGNMDEKKIAAQVKAALDETFRKLSARKLALNFD